MTDSLPVLLAQSIDYAGVFPPARLPLDQALSNYAQYRKQPEAWLLGRFVCPVNQLSALTTHANLWRDVRIHVTVVGTAGAEATDFLQNVHRDVQKIVEFHKLHPREAEVESLELKLPVDASESVIESLLGFVEDADNELPASKSHAMDVFLEIPAGQDWERRVTRLLRAIEIGGYDRFGMKIRMGGLSEHEIPSPERVAFFIDACRATGVIWKATAGLHHPLSCPDSTCGESQFGFLNLLAAAVLASVHGLTESQITNILRETSISQFRFDQDSFAWGDFRATLAEIEQGRRQSMRSLGSCSFDEPRAGLRNLQLIALETFGK